MTDAWLTSTVLSEPTNHSRVMVSKVGTNARVKNKKTSKTKNKWSAFTRKVGKELRQLHIQPHNITRSDQRELSLDEHDKSILNNILSILQNILNQNKTHTKYTGATHHPCAVPPDPPQISSQAQERTSMWMVSPAPNVVDLTLQTMICIFATLKIAVGPTTGTAWTPPLSASAMTQTRTGSATSADASRTAWC